MRACCLLHARGVNKVIVTSLLLANDPLHIHIVASQASSNAADMTESRTEAAEDVDGFLWRRCSLEASQGSKDCEGSDRKGAEEAWFLHAKVPRFDRYISGTGDLTAALLLAWTRSSPPASFRQALNNAFASVHHIVACTVEAESQEILLIQNQAALVNPPAFPSSCHLASA